MVLDAGSANVIISWLEKGLPNFFLFAYFSRNQYYRVCLAVGAPMAVAEPRLPHAELVLGPPLAAAVELRLPPGGAEHARSGYPAVVMLFLLILNMSSRVG